MLSPAGAPPGALDASDRRLHGPKQTALRTDAVKDPDHQKNLILAVVLSMMVLLGWQLFYAGPQMREEQQRQQSQRELSQQPEQAAASNKDGSVPAAPAAAGAVPGAGAPVAANLPRAEAIGLSPRVEIDTPSLKGSVALRGGRFDDVVLVKYHETVDPTSPNVVLFSPSESQHPYFAEYGWVPAAGTDTKVPDRDTLWQLASGTTLTPSSPVTLSWDNGQGLTFTRTISVDDRYMFKIVDEVENKSGAEVALAPYARVHRYGTPKIENNWILHEGLIGVIGKQGEQRASYADARDEPTRVFDPAIGGWIGFTDKYWAATVIPDQTAQYRAQFSGNMPKLPSEQPSYQTDYMRDAIRVAPGAKAEVESQLFAGAKQMQLLQHYQNTGILQFDLLIDWGWFFFITKPLFQLMEWINSHVHNFGITILILTVLVRLAFFPLANKQFASMAKMKKLQPQMEQIRDRFKDDKVRQQQALMDLYRKEKVNPVAGCLPILLQIPVFFALYKVLYITIDMRHAPFFGWIKDLSAPDPTSIFNLFGLLPYSVPEFMHIGIWPLIMGVTMWLQMQLNPQQPDPIQQKIFNWMPVLFTFLLASFPAGLVIYWAWSNTLSLAQQYYIMKKQGVEVHLAGNLSRQFKSLASTAEKGAGLIKKRPDKE
ncbi:membrane protein insertase YidC [Hyphomicrobium sp. D-2]|uniref:membrane protein insertase YidC n=1 Tax=Hyphomicrobium sp. D-2 TaxID=3041621 RepID=UPI00245889A0|nr:membrane protein insertase YidC [Hyphomicrobium sp. D-2]MDH4983307.1 membrane protein insertase YidC [Hyphomicrobium sp. D-2]